MLPEICRRDIDLTFHCIEQNTRPYLGILPHLVGAPFRIILLCCFHFQGFCDDRDTQVKILRPLYLFDSKEIEYYNKYNNITYVHARTDEVNTYSSIHTLMKKFVMDLQNNFPSTVTTVLKTGDKIERVKGKAICQLCKAPLCDNVPQLTSEESTKFSSLISNTKVDFTNLDFVDKPLDQTDERVFCLSCNELSKCLINS
ncbi:unnamed protein product [Callosobruchus maculatus]|uniref:Cytoplasmic tRNA 2-thiolation protein 2 n=1 Tax=Callosobruchus maculatus TaxID=64391 RepID=A0A653DCQ4_CALMS|nr:unnamed protein product [Callosobruchus maculatus]